jgi:predicted cation transporter
MDQATNRAVLLGLIISGGMLIPGNIPNIIDLITIGIYLLFCLFFIKI